MSMDLDGWRSRIDALNSRLVELLNERARCALGIAALKKQQGKPVQDPLRESEVLEGVQRENTGPLSDAALVRIFNCIMEEHRKLEEGA
jgi:chorismate mutase